jgi:hypothetical protein
LDVGLRRHRAELSQNGLNVEILPLQPDAPIYFSSPAARSALGNAPSLARIDRVELISRPVVELSGSGN